jgi:predicted nucleic acid-binding protein
VIVLDTSVLSRVFRRSRPGPDERRLNSVVTDLMADDDPLGLPGIVLQEVLSGIRSERQFDALEQRLLASFSILNPGTTEHVQAARLKNKCLSKGLSVSGADCLIAALTIAGGHELFAADDDFQAIAKHSALKLFEAGGAR